MKFSQLIFSIVGLTFMVISFTSCSNDDDNSIDPIVLGTSVTVTNTFQSTAFTQGTELAIEDLFEQPSGALAATTNTSDMVEFSSYLLGLYDINISENGIYFEVVAQEGDTTYGDLFRTLEPDTYDRYYFTFENAQNVNEFISSNSSVTLRIDSDSILVVEIGEGYDFKPGQNFTITLK